MNGEGAGNLFEGTVPVSIAIEIDPRIDTRACRRILDMNGRRSVRLPGSHNAEKHSVLIRQPGRIVALGAGRGLAVRFIVAEQPQDGTTCRVPRTILRGRCRVRSWRIAKVARFVIRNGSDYGRLAGGNIVVAV